MVGRTAPGPINQENLLTSKKGGLSWMIANLEVRWESLQPV